MNRDIGIHELISLLLFLQSSAGGWPLTFELYCVTKIVTISFSDYN